MHTARRTATCIYLSEPRHRITVNLAWAVLGSLPSSQAIGPRGPKPPGTKALEGATNLPTCYSLGFTAWGRRGAGGS